MAGKNKIMQAVVSFAGTIDPSLGKAMDNVAGHLDKVNWKAVAVGAAVGGIAVATGKAVVEAGKYLAELGDDYNKAMNQLSASTGATGDELDALGESVKNIYAQNLGEDFNDVAEGLAATQKASDLAGEALEQATAAGFVLRDTFDYDIGQGRGEEKKQYVLDFLKQKGFKVDEESVVNAIEAIVKQLNTEGLTIE